MTEVKLVLTDPFISEWSQCVTKFGDPRHPKNFEKTLKRRTSSVIDKGYKEEKKKNIITLEDPQFVDLLSQNNFDAMQFIRSTKFAEEGTLRLKNLISRGGGYDDFSKSPIQRLADQLHNFIKATEDLLTTKRQFEGQSFPGSKEIQSLSEKIIEIKDGITSFFNEILEQNKESYEASKELNRIGGNAFLFTMSTDIDKLRALGQFDEIIRIYEKRKKVPYLEKQMPFSVAIQNIERSLRGVEDSLHSTILRMNPKTFNEKYCTLLMGIQPNKNPIKDIILELSSNVRKAFKDLPLLQACQEFEETYPYCKTLVDYLSNNFQEKYQESSLAIISELTSLINYVNDTARAPLKKYESHISSASFNETLHQSVTRLVNMWTHAAKTRLLEAVISRVKIDLQEWYSLILKKTFTKILEGRIPGKHLIDFMQRALDGNVFAPQMYRDLIIKPLYSLLDVMHDRLVVNNTNENMAVEGLLMLQKMREEAFPDILGRYARCVSEPLDQDTSDDIKSITDELMLLLKEKIMHSFSSDIHRHIYDGVFGSGIDWNAQRIEVRPEGWLLYIINRFIGCRYEWSQIYSELKEEGIFTIIQSLIYCGQRLNFVSVAGRQRIALNIALLMETFPLEALIPLPDPDDPSGQRTIDPPFGKLGRHPEQAYSRVCNAWGIMENEVSAIRESETFKKAADSMDMQIVALAE